MKEIEWEKAVPVLLKGNNETDGVGRVNNGT